MKKRFLSFLMCVCLMAAMFVVPSVTVSADGGDSWSDESNRDTGWTDGAISTPEQLAQFAYLVNSGSYNGSGEVWLTSDIDLAGKEWVPIGNLNNDNYYSGLFNGNGFTVANMSITNFTKGYTEVRAYGLFGIMGGTVEYVNVTGTAVCNEFSQYCFTGGVAGYSDLGKIIGCTSEVNISFDTDPGMSATDIGGIVGANYGEVTGCTNQGDIYLREGNFSFIGGITGVNAGIIDRCQNNGNVQGATIYVGGIAGQSYHENGYNDSPQVTNCVNTGNINGDGSEPGFYHGGICGYLSTEMRNCYNIGAPVDMDANYGNLIGQLKENQVLNNCYYLENGSYGLGCYGSTLIKDDPSLDQGEQRSAAEMQSEDFVTALNGSENAFIMGADYPVLAPLPLSVTIQTDPAGAAVTVMQGDAEINPEADGTYLLVPGNYSAAVSAENYVSKTEEFTVTFNQDTHMVNIALEILPADYQAVDEAIGKANALNKEEYKDFTAVESAVNAVDRSKNITQQAEVDAMAQAIENAIAALQYKEADYSKVDEAIAKAGKLDRTQYKDFAAVEPAVNAVDRSKNITQQAEVDAMAQAIENAIAALQYKEADYSKVDEAIAKAGKLDRTQYKDFTAVESAVNTIDRSKNITQQAEVNAMAQAIEDAINALAYKDADYTKVDEAIAKAEKLDKSKYKDFTAVESAIKAVVRGKNITEQSEVDAMAKAIEDAINGLEEKPVSKPASKTPSKTPPKTPSKPSDGTAKGTPRTGDYSNMKVWLVLFLISGGGAAAVMIYIRKKKRV